MDVQAMDGLNEKLDRLLEAHIFDAVEVEKIRRAVSFVEAFPAGPDELVKMQLIYRNVSGWMTVTSRVAAAIAFIVFMWTQWDRLLDLIGLQRSTGQ